MRNARSVTVSALLLLLLSLALPPHPAAAAAARPAFAADAFTARWERVDRPVARQVTSRSWLWGPGPNSVGIRESYVDSPGGERLVQYVDKSRMEINRPGGAPQHPWYVTNGRLPVELITGRIQTGDDQEFDTANPARVPAVGDPGNAFPRYADLRPLLAAPGTTTDRRGQRVTRVLTPAGPGGTAPGGEEPDTEIVAYVVWGGGAANVPRVFHEFMRQAGLVWGGSDATSDYVYVEPIIDPIHAYGYPITEPAWVQARVAGQVRWVMLQCYERRCLTYTPGNPAGFIVEAGNVGRHYWQWRYGTPPEPGERAGHWSAMTVGSHWDYLSPGTGEVDRRVILGRAFGFGPARAAVVRERQSHLHVVQYRYWEPTDDQLTLHGFLASDGVLRTYEPAIVYLRRDAPVGATWSTTFVERHDGVVRGTFTWRVRVDGREVVTVAAGTFEAVRLIIERDEYPEETVWFVPHVGTVTSQALEFTTRLLRAGLH